MQFPYRTIDHFHKKAIWDREDIWIGREGERAANSKEKGEARYIDDLISLESSGLVTS
jgi:hypothetical protein